MLWPIRKPSDGVNIRHQITQFGRPLLAYEQTRFLTLDLASWEFIEPWNIRERARMRDEEALQAQKPDLFLRLTRAIVRRKNFLAVGDAVQKKLNEGATLQGVQKLLAECK